MQVNANTRSREKMRVREREREARTQRLLSFIFLAGWFFVFSLRPYCLRKARPSCATRCGQLVNGNLRQTGHNEPGLWCITRTCAFICPRRHPGTRERESKLANERANSRDDFSLIRAGRRSISKFYKVSHTARSVIYEIAYPITLNILRARLYDC